MVKMCVPENPGMYWLNCFSYKCNNCGNIFSIIFPNGDDVIEFEEAGGGDIKYLPLYGIGGYLDLLAKLLPGYTKKNDGNMEMSRLFLNELNKYCEKGSKEKGFEFRHLKFRCPKCRSKDITCLKEEVHVSPEISWLKIDCSLIE